MRLLTALPLQESYHYTVKSCIRLGADCSMFRIAFDFLRALSYCNDI